MRARRLKHLLLLTSMAGAVAVGMLSAAASAQSANEIIRSLAPIKGQHVSTSGRRDTMKHIDRRGRDTVVVIDYSRAIDVTVFFRYNSAELTARAMGELRELGQALRSASLSPHRFVIAGHTDAIGSTAFNQDLSLRRAAAVARHLVQRFGIDADRLVVTGLGAKRLKDKRNPAASANRRVEVVLVVETLETKPTAEAEPRFQPDVSEAPRRTGSEATSSDCKPDTTDCGVLPGTPGARTIINSK